MSESTAAAPAAPTAAPSAPSTPAATPETSTAASTTGSPAASNVASAAAKGLPHGAGELDAKPAAAEPKPGETKAEAIQRMKLKLKVSGKEVEREFDPQELQLYVQKGMGADEKFQAAAQVQKTFQSFMEAVKSNPFEAFKDPAFGDLGSNFKDLVIQHLAKEFEAEDMKKANPQQYELQEYKAKIARYEAQEAAAKEAQAQAAQAESDRRMWAETEKSWASALEKSGLAGNKAFIRQMAEIGRDFLDSGLDLQPELLVAELKNRLSEQQRTFLGGAKGEQLINLLGPDVVNEILSFKVAQAQRGRMTQEPIKPPEVKSPEKEEEIPKTGRTLRSFADFVNGK